MKKLLLIFIFIGCSSDDNQPDPCLCNKIIDAVTFQSIENNQITFRTTLVTVNECTGEGEQMHHVTTKRSEIPKLGQCFKK